jgi:hypothetical protein
MCLNLLQVHTFGGISCEYFADEINHLSAEIYRELDVDFQYFVIGLVLIRLAFKGSASCAKFIAEHTKTPHIRSLVVELSGDYFRWDIVEGAAEGLALAGLGRGTRGGSRRPNRNRRV